MTIIDSRFVENAIAPNTVCKISMIGTHLGLLLYRQPLRNLL
jgi:hypothetical protein